MTITKLHEALHHEAVIAAVRAYCDLGPAGYAVWRDGWTDEDLAAAFPFPCSPATVANTRCALIGNLKGEARTAIAEPLALPVRVRVSVFPASVVALVAPEPEPEPAKRKPLTELIEVMVANAVVREMTRAGAALRRELGLKPLQGQLDLMGDRR